MTDEEIKDAKLAASTYSAAAAFADGNHRLEKTGGGRLFRDLEEFGGQRVGLGYCFALLCGVHKLILMQKNQNVNSLERENKKKPRFRGLSADKINRSSVRRVS